MSWPPRIPSAETGFAPDGTRDERALMGLTAGWMWLLAGLVIAAGLAIPGLKNVETAWVLILGAYGVGYGIASLTDVIPWSRVSMRVHIVAMFVMLPVFGVTFWATGGARSYAQVLMVLPLVFIAYFYRGRLLVALVTLLVAVLATPLVYDPSAVSVGYPGRFFVMTVVAYALAGLVVWLKQQLVDSESRQRQIALRDSLTGLANRRAFDQALSYEVARASQFDGSRLPAPSALIVFDLDSFKEVNDLFGHPVGDSVLRKVAEAALQSVRPADTLARIGGDEFAVVAPRAGRAGAERIVARIERSIAKVRPAPDWQPVAATIGFALLGEDGTTESELMRVADHRLHAGKRGAQGDASGFVA